MELKKKPAYNGYQAYEYLEEGVDYPKFDWARWDWAGRHVVELNAEQEARVAERYTPRGIRQPSSRKMGAKIPTGTRVRW